MLSTCPSHFCTCPVATAASWALKFLGCLADARLRVMVTLAQSQQKQLLLTVPLCNVRGKPCPRDEGPATGPISSGEKAGVGMLALGKVQTVVCVLTSVLCCSLQRVYV